MKLLSTLLVALAVGLTFGVADAEAKRLGGSKSSGMQRQGITQKAPDAPKQATAPTANPATAAPGTAAQPKRSWMGPIAGLAAGLGLAALASHLGFGEELASMLMIGLLVMAVLAAVAFFMRKRAAGAAQAGSNRMAYAMAGGAQSPAPFEPATTRQASAPVAASGSMIGGGLSSTPSSSIPADFDVAAFVRNAKVQFIRLQAAHDAGDVEDIRRFTTPEMFAEIRMDVAERAGQSQHTEVLDVQADVIDVTEESARYIVSVRFTGTIREEAGATPERFDEIWHLEKPREGSGGWLLAGIQQMN